MGNYGLPGAAGMAAFNLLQQLAAGLIVTGDIGKTLRCINWADVASSAAVGAVGPAFLRNVVVGKVDWHPLLTRAPNALIFGSTSLPVNFATKLALPDFRPFAQKCECDGVNVSNAARKVVDDISNASSETLERYGRSLSSY